jgi:hypothetical protein
VNPLRDLAELLREGEPTLSAHVVDTAAEPTLGLLAAHGPRSAAAPAEYALIVEAVREGYLLHYGEPRLLAGHDADLALLAGDFLYALGIERLAVLGDSGSVLVLAELISACARSHAEGAEDRVPELWRTAISAISGRADGTHAAPLQ